MPATSNTYTSDVAALYNTKDEVDDGGETNEDGDEVYFQRYTSTVELARYCEKEMSQTEFEDALDVTEVLKGM